LVQSSFGCVSFVADDAEAADGDRDNVPVSEDSAEKGLLNCYVADSALTLPRLKIVGFLAVLSVRDLAAYA